MEKLRNRSHDPREDLRSRGDTKAKSRELVNFAERHEPKKLSGIRMHQNSQIQLLQDDVSWAQWGSKARDYIWPPRPQGLMTKNNGCNSPAKKAEPARWLPFGAEIPPPEPSLCPGWCGGKKKPPRPRFAPRQEGEDGRLWKNDEPARGASRGELYLLVPPCDLFLTAALDKAAKEDVEESQESSSILTIAVDNREWLKGGNWYPVRLRVPGKDY